MRIFLLLAILRVVASAAPVESGWQWRETLTAHFRILHEQTFLPPGFTMSLENINSRLHRDLGIFSNWSLSGRSSVYLYADQKAYAAGQFHPPPWSNGVAIYDQKAVAIPMMKTQAQMLRVLAHENTHLIFVNYFRGGGGRRDPPHWVNEGLAMLEEADSPDRPQTSQWYQSMVMMDPRRWFPLMRFFAVSPTTDLKNDPKLVEVFYVQAYSVTHFLVRKHTPMQFKAFCDKLRDGVAVADALRLAYQYRSVADFERDWRKWLSNPEHRRRVEALPLSARATDDGVIDQAGAGGRGSGVGSGFGGNFSAWKVDSLSNFSRPLQAPNVGSSPQPAPQP